MDLAEYLKARKPKRLQEGKESLGCLMHIVQYPFVGERASDEELLTEYYTKWKGENSKPSGAQSIPRFYTRVRFCFSNILIHLSKCFTATCR